MFAEVDSLIKDSIIITEDSSIYLHNIDLYTAAAVLAMDDDDLLKNIIFATSGKSRRIVLLVKSNFSCLAEQLQKVLASIVQSGVNIQSISEVILVNTHLNEYSHIEQLEWHPEWQGIWSSSNTMATNDDMLDKTSSAGSVGPNLGYFDAIARKLGVVLQHRVRIIVTHICLSSIWLTNNIFALNYETDLFPDLSITNSHPSAHAAESRANSPSTIAVSIQDFASVLSSFLDHADIKDNVYAVGPLSNEMAKSLVNQAQDAPRRSSSNSQSAAVIIVDRTLDLGLPAMHSTNPMDMIYEVYPRSRPHSIDCLMDPKSLGLHDEFDDRASIADTDSWLPIINRRSIPEVNKLLQSMFNKPEKEILVTLQNSLGDFICRNIKPVPDEMERLIHGPASFETLESMSLYLKAQPGLVFEHEEHVVIMLGLVHALSASLATRQELLSAEKVITALFAQTRETSHIFHQLNDMLAKITKEKQSGRNDHLKQSLSTRDVLLLTLRLYSVIGKTAVIEPQYEVYLQKGFVQAMMATNPKANVRAVTMWVQRVFQQLSKVSCLRSCLVSQEFQHLVDFDSIYPYTPFLVKMARHLLADSQNSLSADIIHYPYRKTISKVLTGISMLMGAGSVLSNHPSSYSTVVLFVVGGITFQEVSILQNMYREKGIHLIVGSNTICNRDSLMQHIFKSK